MKYIKELDDLFRKYEIDNYADFAKNAELLNGHCGEQLEVSEHALLLDDLHSDPNNIGYIYIVDRTGQKGQWEIIHVRASYQLATKRNETGVLVISKEYFAPIPSRAAIQIELLSMMALEKVNELLFRKQRNQSGPDYDRRFRK